jgi:hypothetical protein
MWLSVDQMLGRKAEQSLTKRGSAHPHVTCQPSLVEFLTGFKAAAQDPAA